MEDVEGTLVPRSGALAFSASARVAPGEVRVKITDGTLGAGGVRSLTEASVRARVEFEGGDVRSIVAAALGPEPAVGGAIAGRLDVSGTLGRPRAVGELELRSPTVTRTSPTCGEPRRRTLALSTVKASVSWRDGRLVVQPLTSGLGRGTATTTLRATPAPPTRAELPDLVLDGIPLERVLVDFLCQGYAVTGPLDLTGALTLTPTDPARTLSGSGRFRVGAGKVVGPRALSLLGGVVQVGGSVSSALSPDVPASLASSPLEFDSIAGTYQIAHGVVTTRDLLYTSRAMKASVRGDYAIPTSQVNADVLVEHRGGVVQARVTGSTDSPSVRFNPSVARGLDPEGVERGFRDLLKKFR
jgi:hypothetical protein